ncbi:glycoside hydrolase family 31 protein [Acidomonas methanolica]|uniref:glycoside hydrolase family 31 protein n=1 Tax=Acidomonas methanolica TaxID=437 RepID=UPI00211A256A|nr:TIM-barrel domain-containing protein [Acidomonas methanolica]MCQ9156756.1 alpha-glucosidase [Acidomonas methanolica]
MRNATLSAPPVFSLSGQGTGWVALTSDTGARAEIFVLEDDIVRLLVMPGGATALPPSWAIAPGAEDVAEPGRDRHATDGFSLPAFALDCTEGEIVIRTARLRLSVTLRGLRCCWAQKIGEDWVEMFADRATQAYNFGWWDARAYHYIARADGESYYGLGERAGALDLAGRRHRLRMMDPMGYDAEHTDALYKSIPFILAADQARHCFGMFYDTMADASVDLGCEIDNYHGNYRYFVSEDARDIDLYVIAGPDALAVVKRFTWLTGRPALMPAWSLGYSGSTMTYTDAPDAYDQMMTFVDKLRRYDIGCSSFHLSSGYTSIGDKRYVFNWNRDKFPDPAAFITAYRDAGIELVPNIKPALLRSHPRYDEVAAGGYFVNDAQGNPVEAQFWDEVGSFIDFTNPKAAVWWREGLTANLLDYGILSTWNDNNEYGLWDPRARFDYFGQPGPAAYGLSLQPLLMMRASRAAQQARWPDKRPYVVTRSGMAGMQRYAQTWSGDNYTAWKTIRFNARMGLSLALSGVSNTGHDIGGFYGPSPGPELLVRWVQAGITLPRFSIHSWNAAGAVSEPWMHPEVLPEITRLMALRQRLEPFLFDLAVASHRQYEPMLRPVWTMFPHQHEAWQEQDTYMLGPDVLVAIIADPGREEVEVNLPGEGVWTHLFTGQTYAAGRAHVKCTLADPPVMLVRSGAVVALAAGKTGFGVTPETTRLVICPPVGNGVIPWVHYDERVRPVEDGPACSGMVTADGNTLRIEIEMVDGGAELPQMVIPPGEIRSVTVNGVPVATVLADGWLTLRLGSAA